jgi:hypothetical protein
MPAIKATGSRSAHYPQHAASKLKCSSHSFIVREMTRGCLRAWIEKKYGEPE